MISYKIDELARKIKRDEEIKRKMGIFLRELGLFEKVDKMDIGNLKIGGEDSGVVRRSTHIKDIIFLRAIASIFIYQDSKLRDAIYFPSKSPEIKIESAPENLNEFEFSIFWGLKRVFAELEVSINAIRKYSPDYFLMDGSLCIHPMERPKKESELYKYFEEVSEKFKELFELCREKGCTLIGVIEDSRSNNYCNWIIGNLLNKVEKEKAKEVINVLSKSRDTNLLYYALKVGEKTNSLNLLKEINYFYIKVVSFDRPLRIEYLNWEDEKKIASLIYTLSSKNRRYGMPNVLIECDLKAKISQNFADAYLKEISMKTGLRDLLFLRRENRPFG